MGPVHVDPSWQARTPGALDVEHFQIDWQHQRVTCPQGQQSSAWYLNQDAKGESIVQILFPKQICQACSVRETCTDAQKTGRCVFLKSVMNSCKRPVCANKQRSLRISTMDEQELKEPSRKQPETRAYGDLVISVSKKRTSSISFQEWQPIFCASCNGERGLPGRKLGPHVLPL